MRRAWNKAAWLAFAAALVACGGSGASGCSGCGGSTLPADYPHDERVQNAGTVRVTRAGLDFLAENGPSLAGTALGGQSDAGVASFEIPSSTQTGHADVPIPIVGGTTPIDYTIHVCPAGPKPTAAPPECTAEIDLETAKLAVDAITPNVLRLRGDIPVRLKDLPLKVDTSVGASVEGAVGLGTPQGSGCDANDKTKPTVDYKIFPVEITLPLVGETHAPRDGYMKVDVDAAQVNLTVAKEDISVCASCGTILDTLGACDFLVGQAKDQAFQSFGGTALGDQIKSQLKTAVCEKPNPQKNPPCPAGTTDQGGVCVFAGAPNVCATALLGTAGHMDAASLLAGMSASEGGFDYLFAASGALDPAPGAGPDDKPYPGHTPNGATITLFGGTRAAPASQCVPAYTPTVPANIPVPDELRADAITPWPANTPGPHLGVALAGRFLDFAFGNVYASGALCLGVTTEQVDQLKTGLLSLVIPSLKNMTFEQKGAAMAITTRPQAPPHLELGSGADLKTDPLLKIELDKFAIDFYVFSLDRFVRVFTFTADLTVPVNLQTGKDPEKNPNGGILPVLGELGVANAEVTGSPLLLEEPSKIAASLTSVMGGLTSQLTGSISPIDLASALQSQGLALTIPEGGIRRLKKNEDSFLAIFGNLEVAQAAMLAPGAHARIVERVVDKDGMSLATLRRATRPILKVAFGSSLDGTGKPVEWSYAVDRGARSAWSAERTPSIQSDDLVFQGRHVLRVWSRLAGDDRASDTTPAEVPFVIDALPPDIHAVEDKPAEVHVEAFDWVSDAAALRARVRRVFGDRPEPFGEWTALDALGTVKTGAATALDVEVKDEEANVGRTHVLLIRGRTDPTLGAATAGCGCETAGKPGPAKTSGVWALVLGALALAVALRRRRSVNRAAWAAFGVAGAAATLPACSCGGDVADEPLCGPDCKQACGPALPLGMIGAYTSVAKKKDGSLLIAGYADATIDQDGTSLYGDLVVGTWDAAKGAALWEAVDGVPQRTDGTCPTNDRHGFRGGESDPGDDVGLWTTMATGPNDEPMVAYHDATHRSLKFAYKSSDGWKTYALFGRVGQDAGRYAKLLVVDGAPVVVFLVIEPDGNAGKLRSRIVLGRANMPVPTEASKWVFQDLNEDADSPCRAEMCGANEACVKDTKACTPTTGGCAKCATGEACVAQSGQPTCVAVLSEPAIQTIPEVAGAYLSIAQGPKGLGIVAYDRIRGNLLAFSPHQGSYTLDIVDGEVGSRSDGSAKDTGDVGEGAALAIAPDGLWHIAAIDGTREALVHYVVDEGHVVGRDIVDDGSGYPDGKHIVGDDATIRADERGVTICYQDSTALELRCATAGAPDVQGKTTFARSTIAQPGRQAGFFPQLVPGERRVVNHWRALDRAAITYSGDVAVLGF